MEEKIISTAKRCCLFMLGLMLPACLRLVSNNVIAAYTFLTLHCKEDPIYVFPEMKLRGLVPNFYIRVSVSNLYIPRVGHRYINVGIGNEAAQYHFWDFFSSNFRYSIFAVCPRKEIY
jgi:hypothetical protein